MQTSMDINIRADFQYPYLFIAPRMPTMLIISIYSLGHKTCSQLIVKKMMFQYK